MRFVSGIWGGLPVLAAGEANYQTQWFLILGGAIVAFGALLALMFGTRAGIIARATMKEAIRQPVFAMLMIMAIGLLVINTFVPFFSLGDDFKMLKDCGLATVLISGLILATWTASTSIADEIEGKTAMTLLSKPVNRRQFVIGKYFGILSAVLILIVPIVIVFLGLLDYKVFYDAREASRQEEVNHAVAFKETIHVLPGVILSFLEIAVLTAVSVAISTRVPMVVNMVTCLAVFVVGHLTPLLVQQGVVKLELVLFMARIIATVLPALSVFNMEGAVATGSQVPPVYVAWSAVYAAAYCGMAILLALLLFEDRDLA